MLQEQNNSLHRWQPSASIETLQKRAAILAKIRQFFAERNVLEVDTPSLSPATVTDPHIMSIPAFYQAIGSNEEHTLYLQTSPEYAMKRLLAAGSGSIYQITKAFRQGEAGRLHNPEFTMLEWYRLGYDHHQLMDEVDLLLQAIMPTPAALRMSYAEAFIKYVGIDPHQASIAELKTAAVNQHILFENSDETELNFWLDLLFTQAIEPRLGKHRPCFIYDYPLSQAALAKIRLGNPSVASRFEVYFKGVELANGFHELQDAAEQRKRFEADKEYRVKHNIPLVPLDENLLAALEHGLPECAGVALGIDRLIALALGFEKIANVLSFEFLHNAPKEPTWQAALSNAITDPQELFQLLNLDKQFLEKAYAAAKLFPLKVPKSLLSRIQKGNINDPILQQLLPLDAELNDIPGYSKDPLQEKSFNPIPGLLHKYHGRVLLTLTSACGINCRFCFRRHFPYAENNPGTHGWQQALDYIAADTSIKEVILSGGDPLIVSDHLLTEFSKKLNHIPQLTRIRIHSRIPIVLPERITPEFIQWCTHSKLKIILVTHCNHAQEINHTVIHAMQQLSKAGVTLLNQAVLLKGINDHAETLIQLSEALFAAGISPYYLHLLDKVQGAAHFNVELSVAKDLHWQVAQQLPGYLVPKLVCEQPGAPAKLNMESLDLFTG